MPPTIPPLYNQDDSQLVNGVSVGSIGRLTSAWELFANFAYLDSSLETQTDANRGNRLTLTPKYSASLWTTYRLPFRLTVGGGIRATDAVFINAANTIQAPGYRLIDGLVEYEVNRNLTLRLNLSNLTDETYIRNVNNNGGRLQPGPAARGAPDVERHVLTRPALASERTVDREGGTAARGVSMLLTIPDVLTGDQVAEAREHLARADWVDGRVTAGHQSSRVKDNLQLPEDHPAARALGEHDPRGAAAQSAVHLGGACRCGSFRRSSTSTRADSRSAATSTTPSGRSPARRFGFARTSRPRSFSASPTSTTAASWPWKTPTACTA